MGKSGQERRQTAAAAAVRTDRLQACKRRTAIRSIWRCYSQAARRPKLAASRRSGAGGTLEGEKVRRRRIKHS